MLLCRRTEGFLPTESGAVGDISPREMSSKPFLLRVLHCWWSGFPNRSGLVKPRINWSDDWRVRWADGLVSNTVLNRELELN